MRIRLLTSLAGMSFSYSAGSVVDWPDAEAERFIQGGLAEPAPQDGPRAAVRPEAPNRATNDPAARGKSRRLT